jgi:hypothetical protein
VKLATPQRSPVWSSPAIRPKFQHINVNTER